MERDGAFFVPGAASGGCDRRKLIRGDVGYRGERLQTWSEQVCGWKLEIVKRPSKWGRYRIDVEPPPTAFLPLIRTSGRRERR
jgi:hypothetical protein